MLVRCADGLEISEQHESVLVYLAGAVCADQQRMARMGASCMRELRKNSYTKLHS